VLFSLLPLLLATTPAQTKSIVLPVAEDSYVVVDFNDPSDREHLAERNLGSLDFVKTWYAWKVLKDEKAASFVYLKFDISVLKGRNVEWAALQLYVRSADTTFVSAHLVRGDWSELIINYNNAPPFEREAITVTPIYEGERWYTWGLDEVLAEEIEQGATKFSLALMQVEMVEGSEMQVVFDSREAGSNIPRLVVVYSDTSSFPFVWIFIGSGILLALGVAFVVQWKLRKNH
jgi:hypothetical protein